MWYKILYHGICGMLNITFGLLLTLKRKDYMEGKLKEGEDANKLSPLKQESDTIFLAFLCNFW